MVSTSFVNLPTFDDRYNFYFGGINAANGTTSPFTPTQLKALSAASITSSSISLIAALIVICTFTFWKRFRTPCNRLIFFMASADLLSAIAMLIGAQNAGGSSSSLCTTQAFMLQWGDLSSIAWTASMSFNLLLVLFMTRSQRDLASLEKFYFFVSYGITFLMAFVPIFIYSQSKGLIYGEDVLFCWIRPNWPELRMALFYGPVWCIFIFNLTIYTISGIKIITKTMHLPQKKAVMPKTCLRSSSLANAITEDRRSTNFSGLSLSSTFSSSSAISSTNPVPVSGFRRRYFIRVSMFLTAYILVWIMPSYNRVMGWAEGSEYEQANFNSYLAQQILTPLRGFIDFCCYFLPSWWLLYKEQRREERIMMLQSVASSLSSL